MSSVFFPLLLDTTFLVIVLLLPIIVCELAKQNYSKAWFVLILALLGFLFLISFGGLGLGFVSFILGIWAPLLVISFYLVIALIVLTLALPFIYIERLKSKISADKTENYSFFKTLKTNKKVLYLSLLMFFSLSVLSLFVYFSFVATYGFSVWGFVAYIIYLLLFVGIYVIFQKYKYWQIAKKHLGEKWNSYLVILLFLGMICTPLLKINCYSKCTDDGYKITAPASCVFVIPETESYGIDRIMGKGPYTRHLELIDGQLVRIALVSPYFLLFLTLYLTDANKKKERKIMKK